MIVDTGNGVQCLWQSKKRIPPGRFPEVEAVNRALTITVGGKTGTQDVSRILRMPYTINLPNATKRKRGCVTCKSSVYLNDDGTMFLTAAKYTVENFANLIQRSNETNTKTDVSLAPVDDYNEIIRNGALAGDRSELFHRCVWHLAKKGLNVQQIVDKLGEYPTGIGERYIAEERLPEMVKLSYEKWRRKNHFGSSKVREIEIVDGEIAEAIDAAHDALVEAGIQLFVRGRKIVEPVVFKRQAADDRTTSATVFVELDERRIAYLLNKGAMTASPLCHIV